jgi:hypothetical protein
MPGKIKDVIKKMGRGIFEDVESLSMVSIYDIHFTYNTNMEGYPRFSLDIPKLCENAKLDLEVIKR